MLMTVANALKLDHLKSLRLIAGENGLKNKIAKVGILDFEFTKQGSSQRLDQEIVQGEFLMTSFLYAKDNDLLIFDAVKRAIQLGASGLAIKNVFSLPISDETIRYANVHAFPIFVFSDHTTYFEDIIIDLANAASHISDCDLVEKISTVLHEDISDDSIRKLSLEINSSFKNNLVAIYFNRKDNEVQTIELIELAKKCRLDSPYASVLKYKSGFFYVTTLDYINLYDLESIAKHAVETLGIDPDNYYIGVSNPKYQLSAFKKALQEGLYAAQVNKISGDGIEYYKDLGTYKLLLPFINEPDTIDFCFNIVDALKEYDITYKTNLLETAITYVECNGSIKETSAKLFHHENTIRYRISKISDVLAFDVTNKNFYEELSIALKIYKIREVIYG